MTKIMAGYFYVMNSTKNVYLEMQLAFAKASWLFVESWIKPDDFL